MADYAAHYAQWGKGKIHVRRQGESATVCGIPTPDEVRSSIYSPMVCAKCKKADPAAVDAAEADRKARYAAATAASEARRERERAGHFVVTRCKACGIQLTVGNFCLLAGHQSEPEQIEVRGPAWAGHVGENADG